MHAYIHPSCAKTFNLGDTIGRVKYMQANL